MRIRLVVVGKPRDHALAAAIAGYETRAGRYWPLEVTEVREGRGHDAAAVRSREATRLLEHSGGARLVACDPGGDALDSVAFAGFLQQARERGRDLALVIGGAHGLDDAVRAQAERRLSLAPWTLPHELARLVLAEQLYRAGTIVRREPYHK